MPLYDKLLPRRSKRSGTSLARICVRNALQMGKQLPYPRVRFVCCCVIENVTSGTEQVHYDFEICQYLYLFICLLSNGIFHFYYLSLKQERQER